MVARSTLASRLCGSHSLWSARSASARLRSSPKYGAKWSVTLEAPGSVSYVDQVLGENEAMHEIIAEARARQYGVPGNAPGNGPGNS